MATIRSSSPYHFPRNHCSSFSRVTPIAILFDKEFTGSYALLDAVRQYADPRDVYATPTVKQGQIVKMVQDAWDNEDAEFVPEAIETLYHCSRLHKSPSDPRGAHHIILTYHCDEIRPDLSVELPSSLVYQDPATGIGIRGIAWYCNRQVPMENASRFASLYARRWACEALFMRHVTLMGRSQSQYADTRHFAYAASFHILALYGAWRALRRHAKRATQPYPEELSHVRFFGLLQGGILNLLAPADQLTAPLTF